LKKLEAKFIIFGPLYSETKISASSEVWILYEAFPYVTITVVNIIMVNEERPHSTSNTYLLIGYFA